MERLNKAKKLLTKGIALALACVLCMGLAAPVDAGQKTIKILMIGNSLTARDCGDNYTIPYLKKLAKSGGYNVSITKVTKGGQTLKTFSSTGNKYGKKAQKAIDKGGWDIVVLQDQTDTVMRNSKKTRNAVKKLAGKIRKKSPDARILLDATWGYNKTIKPNGKSLSMKNQSQMIENTMKKAANDVGGEVVRSGMTFAKAKKITTIYKSDKNHPNPTGALLHASCLYSVMFKTSPTDASYRAKVKKSTADKLKAVAWNMAQ